VHGHGHFVLCGTLLLLRILRDDDCTLVRDVGTVDAHGRPAFLGVVDHDVQLGESLSAIDPLAHTSLCAAGIAAMTRRQV
jgi:hypothetical protein